MAVRMCQCDTGIHTNKPCAHHAKYRVRFINGMRAYLCGYCTAARQEIEKSELIEEVPAHVEPSK